MILSYSTDFLFLITHALNRYHEGQRRVTIQIIDGRLATDEKGERAAFYRALDLYRVFGVHKWHGWTHPQRKALSARKFTQELLSHGIVLLNDTRFKQANIEDLVKDGLYKVFPAFSVPAKYERARLWKAQVAYRRIGYPPKAGEYGIYSYDKCAKVVPVTKTLLDTVQRLARHFMRARDGEDPDTVEPHLHIFLSLLTFQKRPRKDPILCEWIRNHYRGMLLSTRTS